MTLAIHEDWRKDFGLEDRKPPHFFTNIAELDSEAGKVPYPHAIRRAFQQLHIDGVLCRERSPIIYFRQVKRINSNEMINLHRAFWNQGIAPILVIIALDEIHIYSGLIPPEDAQTMTGQISGFVQTLERVQDKLKSFLLSVESGEYFHIHRRSFDPNKRVERDLLRNLSATRQKLSLVPAAQLEPQALDNLLCRLVFTCYLFDRGIIGLDYLKALSIHGAAHLKEILSRQPRTLAKADLYTLFVQLGKDFNGDLFTADLMAESRQIKVAHLDIIDDFFHGTDVQSGQTAFWSYDFSYIQIETISAIYEHFLKAAGEEQKKEAGAFYTPRFLAEFVLDVALEGETSLLDKRFLDPACGSGIFLVGLFNRLAEEWKMKNSGARYDRRAKGLMDILRKNLHGIDSNRSACQITAFSLYLAFLDQLSPPDIQQLLGKWERLPYLVSSPGETGSNLSGGTIRCADFFTEDVSLTAKAHIIVGNPPWGSSKDRKTPAVCWCAERGLPHPDRQVAAAFIWKAPSHLEDGGKVCFVLPHGTLFNHNDIPIRFQQLLFRMHAVDRVINLTDFRMFLFENSKAGSLVVRYRKEPPGDSAHLVEYRAPKTDWTITQAEIVSVLPQDHSRFTVREILDALKGDDAPLIWKERFWATPRDRRLLDRLSLYPRLRGHVRQTKEKDSDKPWLIAQGFQPLGPGDAQEDAKTLTLPTDLYIDADDIDTFLMIDNCQKLPSTTLKVRRGRSGDSTTVFEASHILVTRGFSRCAYTDFSVAFRSSVRGIHGPINDRELLIFLSFYLRSTLARYYLFHTSSSWGVTRPEVHDQELLRLPFPLPDQCSQPQEAWWLVREAVKVFEDGFRHAVEPLADRENIAHSAQASVEKLIESYFDIDDTERMLIADTAQIIIPSIQPSRAKTNVPTIAQSTADLRAAYAKLLCKRLNGWAASGYKVHGMTVADSSIGVGMVVLEKTRCGDKPGQLSSIDSTMLNAVESLKKTAAKGYGTFEIVRGLKVFHKNLLFITKPLGQRFWTNTAALNDADEIAATILTRSISEGA